MSDALLNCFSPFSSDERRLAVTLYHQLAEGGPVAPERLASAPDLSASRVIELLEGPAFRYLVYYDDQHAIAGFGGLAVVPMHHRFLVDGRTLYTWCAWDALFLPEILGLSARVESRCPETGTTIELKVGPRGIERASHPEAVVSFLRPEAATFSGEAGKTIASFCHYVSFFASRDAGLRWCRRHDGTFVLTLGEAFELGRRKNARLFAGALPAREPAR